jgi:CheY-like chemotaxis protein
VRSAGHTVVGVADTVAKALELSREHRPDLVLADIQLKGGDSGLDAVAGILATMTVPVIFVTGFPEALLTGERPEPAFVVTKPFDPEVLTATIGQALAVTPREPQRRQAAGARR